MPLVYRILGPLEIARDSEPLVVSAAKERTLLVHLLLHANERVSVERLAGAIWEEQPPPSAPKLLQLYISNLRKVLGSAVIATVSGGYRIDVAAPELDSLGFRALLDEGRAARSRGHLRVASDALREALSLWRGTEVAGGGDDRNSAPLEELRLECVEERLTLLIELGNHDEALPELSALCAEQPLRERPRAQLMIALYRAGRQADALEVFRDARRTLDEQLGLEPGEELRSLERAILRHDPELVRPAPTSFSLPLPAPRTQLIGRERERTELRALVRRADVRLLSLVGAGGSGKTRLALALAADANGLFADGVALAELGAVRDPAFVAPAVAVALGVSERPGEPLGTTVAEAIADRDLLLVVDNFEQVIEAGPFLLELLGAAPRLTLVVTSRRVLHISGEQVFTVQPLPDDDAVALFLARAQAGDTARTLPPDALGDIREICRRLDGLPLAIELAAARARLLTPRQLLERLRRSVTVLASGPRDLPARQKTLRDTLAWSVALLGPDERQSLTNLSVFSGGCSLDAAAHVAGADLDRLATLVDHSLLHRDPAAEEPRFQMLETVREYAAEQLRDQRDGLRQEHAVYFTDLAERADLRGTDQQRWLERLDRERDNLRAALDFAAAIPDPGLELRLVSALWRFWWLRGELAEARSRLEQAIARGSGADPSLVAQACAGAAGIAWSQGDPGRAREFAHKGLGATAAGGDDVATLYCHTVLGLISRDEADFEGAREHLEQSASIAAALGREPDVHVAKMNLGSVAFDSGDYTTAVPLWQEVLAYHRARGAEEGTAIALLNLGLAALRLGHQEEAHHQFAEAEGLFDRLGFREYHVYALHGLAAVAAAERRGAEAARLLGRAARLLAETGSAAVAFDPALARDAEASARALLGDEGFATAFAASVRG
ncbi:MAG: AfsR/SARP family transcriptional regulator [Actinobacteria bacterium]|nr:AfsR/SARP family transcriptional regulator [Actinomycetota bacterium]